MTATAPKMRCKAPTCRRPLTNAKSRQRGYGRTCWERIHPPIRKPAATPAPAHLPVGAASDPECPGQFALFEILIVRVPR